MLLFLHEQGIFKIRIPPKSSLSLFISRKRGRKKSTMDFLFSQEILGRQNPSKRFRNRRKLSISQLEEAGGSSTPKCMDNRLEFIREKHKQTMKPKNKGKEKKI